MFAFIVFFFLAFFVLLLHFSCAACDIYTLIMWSPTFVLGQFGQVSIKHHLVHCKLPGLDSSQTKVARLAASIAGEEKASQPNEG